jgi:hypothetical protein
MLARLTGSRREALILTLGFAIMLTVILFLFTRVTPVIGK